MAHRHSRLQNMTKYLPLITATNQQSQVVLFIGTGSNVSTQENQRACSLTVKRLHKVLDSGATPIVINPSHPSHIDTIEQEFKPLEIDIKIINRQIDSSDLTTLGRPITHGIVDRIFINLASDHVHLIPSLYQQSIKLRIPINTYQQPNYSTFHIIPTYTDPGGSGLQISITTNGKGYILDERIKRDIVNNLPSNISDIISNMGLLRDQLLQSQYDINNSLLYDKDTSTSLPELGYGLDNDPWDSHKFNQFIEEDLDQSQCQSDQRQLDQKYRRSRWLSQIMEYYPLSQLDKISLKDLDSLNDDNSSNGSSSPSISISPPSAKGSISLVGSGPGSISMLTLGALHEIKNADLILSDKLVPQTVLDLIPLETRVIIAKKFPGNAERAQNEFLSLGLDALQQGLHVVRLKQGDPYIFGRGGEEYIWFNERGFKPIVIPGLSSSLASTVVAQIPATQRGVADQVLICTGTGRKGILPQVPEYVKTRTTVFLMALHRAEVLQKTLLEGKWDPEVPLAIVERASCPDQRVTRTKLKYLSQVVEEIGSRPPGLIVIGHSISQLVTTDLKDFTDSITHHIDEGFHDVDVDLSVSYN